MKQKVIKKIQKCSKLISDAAELAEEIGLDLVDSDDDRDIDYSDFFLEEIQETLEDLAILVKGASRPDMKYCIPFGIYVGPDGKVADDSNHDPLEIKIDSNGDVLAENKPIAEAVAATYVPRPSLDAYYYVSFKDGNRSNCHKDNLEWKEVDMDVLTPRDWVFIGNKCVSKEGDLIIDEENAQIVDHWIDPDFDLYDPFDIPRGITFETDKKYGYPEYWRIEDYMEDAGFANGKYTSFNHPVVLHKDGDPYNLKSDNLEWTEEDDPRYVGFQKKCFEDCKKRFQEYNKGKHIPDVYQKYMK